MPDKPAVLTITAMTCSGCVDAIRRVLANVPGVSSVEVELKNGRAVIHGAASLESHMRAVQSAGYGAHLL